MDRMGFWNVRGLNDPVKQHDEIKNLLFQHRFSLFILIETRVKPSQLAAGLQVLLSGYGMH